MIPDNWISNAIDLAPLCGSCLLPLGVLPVVVPLLIFVYRVLPDTRAKSALLALRPVPARSVLPGERVKITGRIRLLDPLEGPVTGAPCAYWRLKIQTSSRRSSAIITVVRDECGTPFLVDDGSGVLAQVSPVGAHVALGLGAEGNTGLFDPAGPREAAVLKRYGRPLTGLVLNIGYSFTEGTLREGERVSVAGEAALIDTPDGPRLTIVGREGAPLVISDLPGVHG